MYTTCVYLWPVCVFRKKPYFCSLCVVWLSVCDHAFVRIQRTPTAIPNKLVNSLLLCLYHGLLIRLYIPAAFCHSFRVFSSFSYTLWLLGENREQTRKYILTQFLGENKRENGEYLMRSNGQEKENDGPWPSQDFVKSKTFDPMYTYSCTFGTGSCLKMVNVFRVQLCIEHFPSKGKFCKERNFEMRKSNKSKWKEKKDQKRKWEEEENSSLQYTYAYCNILSAVRQTVLPLLLCPMRRLTDWLTLSVHFSIYCMYITKEHCVCIRTVYGGNRRRMFEKRMSVRLTAFTCTFCC